MSAASLRHSVTRLTFDVGQDYDAFRARYQSAVPDLDRERVADFVHRGAAWDEVVADAASVAPLGFFIFWKMDVTPTMTLAGNTSRCTEFLMGNHTVAERMFRHDAAVMLYVPLRTLIYADEGGPTRFVIDQPSTTLGGFANPAIAEVGSELDQKLCNLLQHLDVPVPAAFALGGTP